MRPTRFLRRPPGPALLLAALLLATPAIADDVTLTDVRLGSGELLYRAPTVIVRGTSLTKAELEQILDQAAPEPLLDRVSRLTADSIEMPEVVSDVTAQNAQQRTTYRDVRFSTVRAGKIASVSAASGTSEKLGDDQKKTEVSFGKMEVSDLDLPLSVGIFTQSGTAGAPLGRLYGGFSIEGMQIVDPMGTKIRIDRMAGRDFLARPTAAGWLGTVKIFSETPDLKAATPEARRRSLDAMAEFFDAFAFGPVEATGITFGGAQGSDGGKVTRVAFTGATPSGGSAEVRVEGIEASISGGRFKLASLTYGGLSMRPLIDMMRESDAWATGTPDPKAARHLFSLVKAMRMEGLEVVGPQAPRTGQDDEKQAQSAPPFGLRIAAFSFDTDRLVDGVPSDIKIGLSHVGFDVPPNPKDSTLQQLSSLGYHDVDASLALSLGWNEAGQELVVRDLALDSAGMGRAAIRAVVGNLSRDLFNPDTAIASVAALGASAKTAEVAIENGGLFERILARESQKQRRPQEDIRREYGLAAAVGIPAILGSSPSAKVLAQAVARFVAKPGRLLIKARAKQASGYSAADFAAAPNPAGVMEAIEIQASAD